MRVDSQEAQRRDRGERNQSQVVRPRSNFPSRIAVAIQERITEITPIGPKKCLLHPSSESHALEQCKRFLGMDVKDRWVVVKDNMLCFICLGSNHISKQCKTHCFCKVCERPHHVLLHPTDAEPKRYPKPAQSNVTKTTPSTSTKPKFAVSSLKAKKKTVLGFVERELEPGGKVGLMTLTAVPEAGCTMEDKAISFYAAIDTGATHSLCSRQLWESLYDSWEPSGCKKYTMFDGSQMQCEYSNGDLNLVRRDGTVVAFNPVTFIDLVLPFSQYLPDDEDIPQRIDMIIGGDLAWKHFLIGPALTWQPTGNVASHDLGTFWLSSGEHCQVPDTDTLFHSLEEKRQNASKVRLAPEDRKHEMKKLEGDVLYHSPIDDKLTMSRVDEKVLEGYKNSVKLVTLDNGEPHLQFNLPWAHDPAIMKDNYWQAKNVLLRLRSKLESQPELCSKYCEKIETAITNY